MTTRDRSRPRLTAAGPRPLTVEWTAAVIAVLYALLKAYWAVGGVGLRYTVGFPERIWNDPMFVALGLWGTVVLAVLAAVIPFALVRPWGKPVPRWMLTVPIWIGCVFTVLRGVTGTVRDALQFTGAISGEFPEGLTQSQIDSVVRWSLFVYSPWFLVWGIVLGTIGIRAFRAGKREQGTAGGSGGSLQD